MVIIKPKKGKLLIAEPSLTGDVSFNRSVVLLAEHNKEGSVGFILNKPLEYHINDLVSEINIPFRVYNGGPVEQDNLYFIHKVPHLIDNSIEISDGIYWGGDFEKTIAPDQSKIDIGKGYPILFGILGLVVLAIGQRAFLKIMDRGEE